MADCELLTQCLFFNDRMASMPSTSEVIKLRYCRDKSAECARYMVRAALGKEQVPEDMFPNHTDKAQALLSGAGRG